MNLKATVQFESSLNIDQKLRCLESLKSGLLNASAKNNEKERMNSETWDILSNSTVNISSSYGVNDDGSIDIPWNFKWPDSNTI